MSENERYIVDFEALRGGWWNEGAFRERYRERSLRERASECRGDAAQFVRSDLPEIWRIVEQIRGAEEKKPFDGTVIFAPNGGNNGDFVGQNGAKVGDNGRSLGGKTPGAEERFRVVGQELGFDLDEVGLCHDIIEVLKSGRAQTIHARIKPAMPRSADEIVGEIGLRGGYTTYFESNPNREHNIALAIEKFNGLCVGNGQSVSFNGAVGARSEARGFKEAKIILDGEFVPGIGGGVCQASTTLFNALLLAGVTIDESHNHSLAISYVPLGRDAMVSSGTDLRFTNNTGATIYFETGFTPASSNHHGHANRHGSVFVKIYGRQRTVNYRPRVVVGETDGPEGEVSERRAATYLDTYKGERLVHTKFIRKSRYNVKRQSA